MNIKKEPTRLKPVPKNLLEAEDTRDLVLCHEDAQGGCPDEMAACGEEDIGSGLEDLVTRHEPRDTYHRR